jgi:serine protease Do
MGTGVVLDGRGYILTNHHVIDGVKKIQVTLADGQKSLASVVAHDAATDLAIIKIPVEKPLEVITIGVSSDLMIGEPVIAVGNAYGYEHTVTRGIISALHRNVRVSDTQDYEDLIQTDASINPGNSGGPLINVNGELVGVNVAIRAGAQGIGFAIPVDHMVRSVADMLRSRRRAGTYDGLAVRDRVDITNETPTRSVVIERVEASSPAAAAGLRPGDTLVRIGDLRVVCSYDLERAFLDRRSGDSVPVVVRRGDQEERTELALGGGGERVVRAQSTSSSDVIWTKLGLQLQAVAGDTVTRVNRQLNGGLEVTDLHADGPAAKAGIRKGDILVGLHSYETLSADNVVYVLSHPDLANFYPLSFYILRSGQVRKGSMASVN